MPLVRNIGTTRFKKAGASAPATINNRFHRWMPRDFHADAVPQSSVPAASVMTNTSNAIELLGLSGHVMEFETGDYYVDRSVSISGGSTDPVLGKRKVYFNETEFIAGFGGGVPVANFNACRSWGGTASLAGLTDATDNLPDGVATHILFDVYNTEGSSFSGNFILNGNNKASLWGFGAANVQNTDGVGCIRASFDSLSFKRFDATGGFFGTPSYGQSATKYAASFVNCHFKTVRFETTVLNPFLVGANQIDGTVIDVLSIAGMAGGQSRFYNTELKIGTCYLGGDDNTMYGFDLQRAVIDLGRCYAEGDWNAPIIARDRALVIGICKYGAGAATTFGKQAFIYFPDVLGSCDVWAHPRSGDGADMVALVKLKVITGAKRNCIVNQGYLEATKLPFAMEADGSQTLSTLDKLKSFASDGEAKWTPAGTSAAPTLTRGALI